MSFNQMVASIRLARAKLEDYANHLEDKVSKRTEELERALEEMRMLKVRQDGDYFLTSLLLDPLHVNHVREGNVRVEFLVKQRKEFQFRHWNRAIGGDLCIAHSLDLGGEECVVYLNADAMGKSMQGAGGALVTGCVFEAFVQRTLRSEELSRMEPEEWLSNAFLQLDLALDSFGGSMLVSAVLGLVESGSGRMHHLNAEHPWSVVLRSGKVFFLPTERVCWKLGVGEKNEVIPEVFQLEAGDVLIAGSDGRDDLVIPSGGSEYIVNEDENLFLRHVDRAGGRLDKILEAIQQSGDLIDDLSLLRLSFRE